MGDIRESPLLSVNALRVSFSIDERITKAVDGIDFTLDNGETLGIVGESGSGKSVSALAILRLLPTPPSRTTGKVRFKGRDLLELSEKGMQGIRGKEISMIFQEPMTSLNPVLTIGDQISESIMLHQKVSRRRAWEKAIEMLDRVMIPEPAKRAKVYPHEMSGGMKQRAMIAMALSSNPSLLIADEPTTALDVTIQKQILFLIKGLQKELGMSVIFITHNFGVVAEVADRVAVMYAGRMVEQAPVTEIFHSPGHPYTLCLLNSIPNIAGARQERLPAIPGRVPESGADIPGCVFHPRCPWAQKRCELQSPPSTAITPDHSTACWRRDELETLSLHLRIGADAVLQGPSKRREPLLSVRSLAKHYSARGAGAGMVRAVDGVSFDIRAGEVLGIVGESGCGKTTLGKCVLRLVKPTAGQVLLANRDITDASPTELRQLRREMQIVFQDPYGSLNPRMKIGEIIGEPMRYHDIVATRREQTAKAVGLLEMVGLDRSYSDKFPHELSGGQRQRIAIARALSVSPKFIVCDEPVSALDVSIQAQILNLLQDLKKEMNLTYLFITHDMAVVKFMANAIAVMYLGLIVELAEADSLCLHPRHPYTQALLASIPDLEPARRDASAPLKGELPGPEFLKGGCRFRSRCPIATSRCADTEPDLFEVQPGWFVRCFYPD
jgi:peptide/nickel transport system ATP-binding protein